jgi:hypothetical protein
MTVATAALTLAGCSSSKHAHDEAGCCASEEVALAPLPGAAADSAKPPTPPPPVAHFGAEMKQNDGEAVPAAKVIASPAEYGDQYVRLTGTVTDVCSKKGCWLRIAADGAPAGAENIFIKFSDPPAGTLIPMQAIGKKVTAEGTLKQGMMSEAAVRHFKEDAGAPREEIEKIVGPQKQLVLSGAAVAIEGLEKPVN